MIRIAFASSILPTYFKFVFHYKSQKSKCGQEIEKSLRYYPFLADKKKQLSSLHKESQQTVISYKSVGSWHSYSARQTGILLTRLQYSFQYILLRLFYILNIIQIQIQMSIFYLFLNIFISRTRQQKLCYKVRNPHGT